MASTARPDFFITASRESRFWAALIDLLVVAIGAGAVWAIMHANEQGGMYPGLMAVLVGIPAGAVLATVAQLVAQLVWRQSIGKRLLGIKAVRRDGSPLSLWRWLFLRNGIVAVLSTLGGVVYLLDAVLIFGEEQRCLHDYLADSMVIEADDP